MAISSRPYRNSQDLVQIGQLIRRAAAFAPSWNGWSFARYDTWAQRRLADEQILGDRSWQEKFTLWEDESGQLAGAAFFDGPDRLVFFTSPRIQGMEETVLEWGEALHQSAERGGKPLVVEALDSHTYLSMLLRKRGYQPSQIHTILRGKRIDMTPPPPLPAGFTVKEVEDDQDLEMFFGGVAAVFNDHLTLPAYRLLQEAPSYRRQLELMLLDPSGQLASFCAIWADQRMNIAEFEPVGTMPLFRQRGLAAALLREAEFRYAASGGIRLGAFASSESPAANALYESVGLKPIDTVNQWQLH